MVSVQLSCWVSDHWSLPTCISAASPLSSVILDVSFLCLTLLKDEVWMKGLFLSQQLHVSPKEPVCLSE